MAALRAAVLAVALLAPTLVASDPTLQTLWSKSPKNYYYNSCRSPCTADPPGYKPYPPKYPKPDPKKPERLICEPGYGYVASLTGFTTPMCVPCESGFYSAGGRSRCLSCAGALSSGTSTNVGFLTPQGASSASQCVCAAGYGGPGCKICAPGTFSTGGRLGKNQNPQPACQVCPDGSKGSSKAGAISKLECGGCNPGFGGLACKACPAGKYSTGGDYSPCKSCGAFQSSRPQSPGPEYCVCAAGYGSTDGAACTLCPIETFWPGAPLDSISVGDALAAAAQRQKAKATLSPCLPCSDANSDGSFTTVQQGTKTAGQCVCTAGYGSKLCSICPQGTWSPGGSTADCIQCGGLGTTEGEGSTSAGACGCQPGYGGVNCERCPANSFSAGGAQSECQPCPINTEAPAGSGAGTACVPKPGFGLVDGVVVPCPVDSWSAGGINQACVPCPDGTVSPSTSKNIDACVCLPGYKPGSKGCIQCQSGEVCPGGVAGGAAVIECPPGATSPPGSDSTADCVCQAGYGGANCDLCPEGYYSPGGSKAGCLSCGLGKTSSAGSISADACVCLAGRGGPTCALCPAGFFSPGLTAEPCTACPDGATTVSTGNKDPSDCICKPSFAGPFCTACQANELCPGGTRLAPVVCPANSFAPVGATTVQQCVCKAGFGRPASSALGCTTCPICEACPVGSYSAGGSTDSCTPCGRTLTTPTVGSISADACVCSPGYGGASCAQCPAGTYSTGFSTDNCTACPENSKSPAGSTSSAACVCAAGYGGPSCSACPAGTYSTGGTSASPNAACTRCGASGSGFTTTPTTAATSDVACVCKPGFGGSTCASCPANTWGAGGDTDSCLACPAGTVSQPNSVAATDCKKSVCPAGQELSSGAGDTQVTCVCQAGYGSGSATTPCTICAAGTFSAGGTYDACKPCGFGLTGPEGAISKDQCVESKVRCPVGMAAGPGAVSAAECACLPGFGATGSGTCAICPAGTYSLGLTATDSCIPCAFGNTSPVGSSSPGACYAVDACPPGTWVPVNTTASTVAECVCRPGFGSGLVDAAGCFRCPVGTYSPGNNKDSCISCPFGTTSAIGSTDVAACVVVQTACPVGMSAPAGAASAAECTCMAGFGTVGGSKDSCQLCPVGSYSAGGTLDPCIPCGFGFTSPAGSKDQSFCYATDQCPPGTVAPIGGGSSPAECICKPGFGGNALGTFCTLCPAGTYSANSGREGCLPCPFGTNSAAGATKVDECKAVAQECPIGMTAPADAVSAAECGCLPGFGIADAANPSKGCAVCLVGTYSPGGTLDACFPCGFGLTSPVNSDDATDCYPLNLVCPPGMEIPGGGGSSQAECACKAGYGAPAITSSKCDSGDALCKCPQCTLCPAGTYAEGGTREQCLPCPFGTTSAPGSTGKDACVVSEVACPPGQIADPGALECHCMAGFGWTGTTGQTGTAGSCQICPVGWWSYGIGLQPCMPCGFGLTSPVGSDDPLECYPVNQCPVGMWVDPDSTSNPPSSAEECTCKPGYGGNSDASACYLCPFSTWNNGKNGREPCQSCGFGFTSPQGATDGAACQRYLGECPNGQGPNGAPSDPLETPTSPATCSCLPGYGDGGIDQACSLCPAGTFSTGGSWQPCTLCPAGTTSLPGSANVAECLTNVNICPAGMFIPAGATTQTSQCVCKAGYGGIYTNGAFVACFQCAPGTFSTGGTTDPCFSCPVGYGGPIGATNITQCTQCPTGFFGTGGLCSSCPIGTTTVPGFPAISAADCNSCSPGFGFATGTITGASSCAICPAGTYSAGGKGPCTLCPLGTSSAPGSVFPSQCFCIEDGFGTVGNDTTTCVLCPLGTYSSTVRGINACVACPTGKTTIDTGRTSLAQCVCAAGYGSMPGTTGVCEPCTSPYYQGSLSFPSGNPVGIPQTTATQDNPYPKCLLCTGAQLNPPTHQTGDVNLLCTFNTTRPSAYCALTTEGGATTPTCGFCSKSYTLSSTTPFITLPQAVLSARIEVIGASGSAGRSIWAANTQNASDSVPGGLGGRVVVSISTPGILSGATLYGAVGQPGATPAADALIYGGGGGGYSAVWIGNADQTNLLSATWLVSAGGGGGGGTITNGLSGTQGDPACTGGIPALLLTTLATQIGSPGNGGVTVGNAANGAPGRGPVGNTGNGGAGSTIAANPQLGAAGGGGGGGYGTGAGAGGVGGGGGGSQSNSNIAGLAGGAPGGGGGGGAGVGPSAGNNVGLTPGGGGGGGLGGGGGGNGGGNTPSAPGQGGGSGVCQRNSALTQAEEVGSAPSRGPGAVNIQITTNTCPP